MAAPDPIRIVSAPPPPMIVVAPDPDWIRSLPDDPYRVAAAFDALKIRPPDPTRAFTGTCTESRTLIVAAPVAGAAVRVHDGKPLTPMRKSAPIVAMKGSTNRQRRGRR